MQIRGPFGFSISGTAEYAFIFCAFACMQMPQVPTAGLAVPDTENVLTEDGQSSESVMTALNSGSSQDNDDGSDISLKLG